MEQEEKKPTTLTGVDLSQTASLLLPWTHDPWGKLRPPLSEEALCMSAELASAAYGMAIEPWVEAGWRDVTIQVDGELTALPPNNPLSAEWRKYWVRARLKPVSALGQMLGALRLSSSNNTTGKAVVMLHPALDGRCGVHGHGFALLRLVQQFPHDNAGRDAPRLPGARAAVRGE